MVAERAEGNRRIYHLQDGGVRAVQDYLEGVWGEAAARFRLLAENTSTAVAVTAPLRISFDVDCPPQHAFAVWTSKIGTWWPRDHTVSGDAEEVVLESGAGGRIYERTSAGVRHEWGEITVWEPPAPPGLHSGTWAGTAPRPRRSRSPSSARARAAHPH